MGYGLAPCSHTCSAHLCWDIKLSLSVPSNFLEPRTCQVVPCLRTIEECSSHLLAIAVAQGMYARLTLHEAALAETQFLPSALSPTKYATAILLQPASALVERQRASEARTPRMRAAVWVTLRQACGPAQVESRRGARVLTMTRRVAASMVWGQACASQRLSTFGFRHRSMAMPGGQPHGI